MINYFLLQNVEKWAMSDRGERSLLSKDLLAQFTPLRWSRPSGSLQAADFTL